MAAHRDPAFVVKRTIPEHLKILCRPLLLRLGIIEAVHHADSLNRLLLYAVEFGRCGDVSSFQDCGHKIDHMVELSSSPAFVLDARRPGNDHRIARATEMRGDLFAPLEWGVHGPCPANWKMII